MLETLLVVFADGDVFRIAEEYAAADIAFDATQVDDIGTVHAHEHIRRECRLHVLEPEKRGDRRAVGKVHPHVLPFAFQVHDVADLDQRNLVIRFHGDVFLVFGQCFGSGFGFPRTLVVAQFVERIGFPRRAAEVGKAEGFEQVIHGVELEPFDSVFRVGRRENHHRPVDQRADELHAAQVGHVDVDEYQVYMLRSQ